MASNPPPVVISEDASHKVTMFNSPDHSIKPLVDFIGSAGKSIDMYIPELISWTYGKNTPRVSAEWLKEENPIFQALANVGVEKKTVPIRIVTNGPQVPFVPMMVNMWEWMLLQNAQVHFSMTIKIGGILIIVDNGDKILLTSMDGSKSSFVYNRESSIIMDKPNDKLVKLFTNTFQQDFLASLPFMPTKQTILGSNPPLIDPASSTLIQATFFPITSIPQPPPVLVESPIEPYISKITEIDDAEFILAMAGPDSVESKLIDSLNMYSGGFLQVGIRSLPYSPVSNAILQTFNRINVVSVILSYTLNSETELNASNANLLVMKHGGMFSSLFLGPLYNQHSNTKEYYLQNGQAFINKGDSGGTVYFMTGGFTEEDLNTKRNFYVAFKSHKMSVAITRLFSGDTLKATLWSNIDQEQVLKNQVKSPTAKKSETDFTITSNEAGNEDTAKNSANQESMDETDEDTCTCTCDCTDDDQEDAAATKLTWLQTWLQSHVPSLNKKRFN